MSFFKSVLSTLTGLAVFSLIVFGVFAIFIGALVASGSGEAPEVKANTVLYINLNGRIKERVAEDPFADLFPESSEAMMPLLKTLEAIDAAKDDENIKGIYLESGYAGGGPAAMHEIRQALEDFKASGKFVYTYGEYYSEGNYYIASVGDEIFLNPIGSVEFNGLSINVSYFKGLFEKLGIEAQIFRVGEYKSAVEPFMRKDMSDENREQLTSLIESIYGNYLKNISTSRGIDLETLRGISDEMKIRKAEDAVDLGLVTKLGYESDLKWAIKDKLAIDQDDDINFYKLTDYMKTVSSGYSSKRVAVVVAEGEIVGGKGDQETVGSDKFAKAIRDARESDRIKAVVIRVNSPGGSMMASDVIWNEIMLTKEKKPVIASMSSMATSGGYYLSMPCDTIVAQPTTITGSIGIFGMLPNMEKLLEDKLGINNESVSTGEFSNLYRVSSALNEQEKSIIQSAIDRGYETFTSKAAEGRNMAIEDLKAVASGRVWTGEQGKENGLVDILGSYNDAVNLAAEMAGIEDDYQVTYYPTLKSKFEEMFGSFGSSAQAYFMESQYGAFAEYVDEIRELEKYEGIQARMPFDLEIE